MYTNDKWALKGIRETSPFTIATKSIKYLRVTLAKQVEDMYCRVVVAYAFNPSTREAEAGRSL